MRCQQILYLFCALCVLVVSEKTDDHKVNHHSQERSHQNRNEKSHILDRHKETDTRIRSSATFRHLVYRDRNQHCQVICNGSPSNALDIQISYNGDAGLISYLNQSAHVAVIQDYSSKITVILNGQSGTAIVENIGKNKYYSLDKNAQTEEVLWISSKSEFNVFFKNLTSLQNFAKLGEEHGNSINEGEDLAKAKSPYLIFLDFKASQENFTVSTEFMIQLNSTLRFIFKGQGTFTIHKNVLWFANVNLAFADIFRDCQTQIQSLDVKLNLTRIYGVNSGVEALVNLLTQLGTRANLANILTNQLRSPEKLLELLAKLSGGSEEGIDGIVTVVITVIRATNGHATINDVISAILNYKPDGDSSSLAKVVDEALDLIESQNRVFNNSGAFQGVVTVLKAINSRNLVFRNINISDILTLLVSRNPVTMIQTIIRIFSRFAGSEGFPQMIREFIQGLNSTNGLNIIARIFPGTNLDNIRHCISQALSNIPIIGNIFRNPSSIGGVFNTSRSIANSIPVIGPFIANGSSGIASGIENAIHGFIDPVIGSGNSEAPPSPPASSSGHDSTESPNAGNSNASISVTGVPSRSPVESDGTKPPNAGNNGTKQTSSPKGATEDNLSSNKGSEAPHPSGSAGTERPKSGSTAGSAVPDVTSPVHSISGAATKETPVLRNGNIYHLHEKQNRHHTYLHESNRKENVHTRHILQEKKHHEHVKASNRKENFNQKHGLQEKNNQHGHLRSSNKNENVYHKHKLHEKNAQEKNHHKDMHNKKHENHHN